MPNNCSTVNVLEATSASCWYGEKRRFQHALYECADFRLLARSRHGEIESRDLVLLDELQERAFWRSCAFMEMQPRLVVFDREIDGFL